MRRSFALLASGAVAAVAGLVGAPAARACSCVSFMTEPVDGAMNVPLNTRIWLPDASGGRQSVQVRVSGGAEVPVGAGVMQWAGGQRLLILTPTAPLAARTTYEISSPFAPQVTRFTTGDTSDSTPPPLPNGRLLSACAALTPGSSCGPSYQQVRFEIDRSDTPIVIVTAGETPPPPSLETVPSSWPIWPNPVSFQGLAAYELGLGRGQCMVWPSSEPRGVIFYGALDLAGNFSGWRRGSDIVLPDVPAGGTDASSPPVCLDYGDGGVAPGDGGVAPVDGGQTDVPLDVIAPGPGGSAGDAAAPAQAGQSDGCACRLPGRAPSGNGAPGALLVAFALVAARRRRPRR